MLKELQSNIDKTDTGDEVAKSKEVDELKEEEKYSPVVEI